MNTHPFYIVKLLVVIFFLSISGLTFGQDLVPFCQGITTIDARMASKVAKLRSYNDFQQATLQQADKGLELNVVYKEDGIFKVDRIPLTEADIQQICDELGINSDPREVQANDNPSQEARRRLILSSSAFSLGYYSWAVPTALKADDFKAYTASYMLIGGAGFFVPLLATNKHDITDGMERAYTMGAGSGLVHGLSLNMMLVGDYSEFESVLGFTTAMSITESLVAFSLAKKHKSSWGYASIVGAGSLWGAAYGAAIPFIVSESEEVRLYGLTTLAGSVVGIVGANYLYKKQPITHGDATIISTTGALGTYWGGVFMETFDINNDRAIISMLTASATGGLAYGIYKTKSYDYTRQEGNLIPLGTFAGGLIGAGFAVLTEAEGTGTLWFTAIGATGGFFLSDWVLRGGKRNEKSSQASNFSFQLNPMGVMGAVNANYLPKTNDPRIGNTIANFRLSF
jgi:hypothetical protein